MGDVAFYAAVPLLQEKVWESLLLTAEILWALDPELFLPLTPLRVHQLVQMPIRTCHPEISPTSDGSLPPPL